MSLIKILESELLHKLYYTRIQINAQRAIERINEFTKSSLFHEADNILLEIKLELLDMNFVKLMQCSDLLINTCSEFELMEDIYTEIKMKLKRKQLCDVENANIKPAIDIPKFNGKEENNYKTFINVFNDKVEQNTELSIVEKINYLKSSLSGVALALVEDVIPKDKDIYNEMLEVLKRRFGSENNALSQTESPAQQHDSKIPCNKNLAHNTKSNEKEEAEELYKNIVQASYSHAVKATKNISSSGQGAIITRVVLRLAQEGNKNLLSYAYQLWTGGERGIVEQYMPKTFKTIFGDWVTPIEKKFGLALKMDANIDGDGDRIVWGDSNDKTSRRVKWKFIPFWENNCVFFKIQNMEHEMFIKLEISPDDIGDRGAFGSKNSGNARHAWVLEPVVINEEILFYIINREFNQGLKLQLSADHMGDRRLWGHNGSIYSDPARFAWSIHRSHNIEI